MSIKQLSKIKFSLNPPKLTPPDKIAFHQLNTLDGYRAVKVCARYNGQWLYCRWLYSRWLHSRAKTREAFEMPGGSINPGETALEAAKRELCGKTGAARYDIEHAFDFKELTPSGELLNGQVFYARIHSLNETPDLGLCDGVPSEARFPDIAEAIFKKLQSWLNLQSAKDELWDIYDVNRVKTGRLHRRGEPLAPGDYHLGVLAILRDRQGRYLITKRAFEKGYAGMWENTGGAAQSGDDSLTAAIRELKEETGIVVSPKDGSLVSSFVTPDAFFDLWLFTADFNLSQVLLQEKETVDARLASREEIVSLFDEGEFFAGPDVINYFKERE